MRTKLFASTLLALAAASLLASPPAAGKDLLLKNGHILPVSGPVVDGDILVRGGKIAAIGPNLAAVPGGDIIDLAGKWVMPGIIDSHPPIVSGCQ